MTPLDCIMHVIHFTLYCRFRFCNDRGILIYQDGSIGGTGFFALGVNSGKIYLEWKTNSKLIEVFNVYRFSTLKILFVSAKYLS